MNSIRGSLHAFCATHPLSDQAKNRDRRYEEHQIVESIARVPAGRSVVRLSLDILGLTHSPQLLCAPRQRAASNWAAPSLSNRWGSTNKPLLRVDEPTDRCCEAKSVHL